MRRFTKTTRPEMPIYEYRCENCGHEFDTLQKVSDDPLTDCPACGKPALVKKVSAAGFRLKGGGWYETDFKSGKKEERGRIGFNQQLVQFQLGFVQFQLGIFRFFRQKLVQFFRLFQFVRLVELVQQLLKLSRPGISGNVEKMRSHYCGEFSSANVGEEVEVVGWVHRRRDHGGVIFLDIRDRTGIVQVVFDPDTEESFATADRGPQRVRAGHVWPGAAATGGHREPGDGHRRDRSARQDADDPQRVADPAVSAGRVFGSG